MWVTACPSLLNLLALESVYLAIPVALSVARSHGLTGLEVSIYSFPAQLSLCKPMHEASCSSLCSQDLQVLTYLFFPLGIVKFLFTQPPLWLALAFVK